MRKLFYPLPHGIPKKKCAMENVKWITERCETHLVACYIGESVFLFFFLFKKKNVIIVKTRIPTPGDSFQWKNIWQDNSDIINVPFFHMLFDILPHFPVLCLSYLPCFCPGFHKSVAPWSCPSKVSDTACDHQPFCFKYVHYCRHENSVFCCGLFFTFPASFGCEYFSTCIQQKCLSFASFFCVHSCIIFSVGEDWNVFHLPCFYKLWHNLTCGYSVRRCLLFYIKVCTENMFRQWNLRYVWFRLHI